MVLRGGVELIRRTRSILGATMLMLLARDISLHHHKGAKGTPQECTSQVYNTSMSFTGHV